MSADQSGLISPGTYFLTARTPNGAERRITARPVHDIPMKMQVVSTATKVKPLSWTIREATIDENSGKSLYSISCEYDECTYLCKGDFRAREVVAVGSNVGDRKLEWFITPCESESDLYHIWQDDIIDGRKLFWGVLDQPEHRSIPIELTSESHTTFIVRGEDA